MRQTLEQAAFEYAQNVALNDLLRSSRQACDDAFKAGAEWQERQSQWMSTKEELPKDNEFVLFSYNDSSIPFVDYLSNGKVCVLMDDVEVKTDCNPLEFYWAAIPEAPKGGEE